MINPRLGHPVRSRHQHHGREDVLIGAPIHINNYGCSIAAAMSRNNGEDQGKIGDKCTEEEM